MGAAVMMELAKPVDGSDIISLDYARREILHLRSELGHLAQQYGMEVMPVDASDLILGRNEQDDFERVVQEVVHIRACLQLNTQTSKRRTRYTAPLPVEMDDGKSGDSSSEDSRTGTDSDGEGQDSKRGESKNA
jgi:hypothetical protein